MTDEIEETHAGDPGWDDFVQKLTSHQDELLVAIRAMCGDRNAALDIRQQVNIVLWKKRSKFIPGSNFKAWAYRIAQLEVKAYFRKRKREGHTVLVPELLEQMTEELPSSTGELPERKRALHNCLQKLTQKDDELIRHRYWTSANLDQLANSTNRSVGTLKARLYQIRTNLRRCVEKQLALGQDTEWRDLVTLDMDPGCDPDVVWNLEPALYLGATPRFVRPSLSTRM